jgi:epsilon-lactone hydrolase
LFLSQPALSRQIRGLEQLLGCELLRRSTRQVELTLAGEALLDRARTLLAYVDEAVTATLAVSGELLGRIARLWEPIEELIIDEENLHATRQAFEEFHSRFEAPAGTVVRPVTAGGVPSLMVSSGAASDPTVVYIHGGAFVIGSAYGYRVHAGALAAAAQTGVLVPDYRLAPEHPFPAAVDDAANAYHWLVARGIAPEAIALVGDSAGASMALSLLQQLRNTGEPLPGAVVVMCPWLDLALHPDSDAATALDPDVARQCATAYLAAHSPDDPVVNPLGADLTGMPPILIQAATGDYRLADAKALAERARAQGVDARLDLYPVDAHAFQLFWSFLPEAANAIQNAGRFIQAQAARAAAQETTASQ